MFLGTNPDISVCHFKLNVLNKGSFFINDKGFILTGELLDYLTIFFNSRLFRFCFKEYFPELLGEARELRKVFFEKINIKRIENDTWYTEILKLIISHKKSGLSIEPLQIQIDEKLFELYQLTKEDRELILMAL